MARNVDDVHSFDAGFLRAMKLLEELDTIPENKQIVKRFIMNCRQEGLAKSTLTHYTNQLKRMIHNLSDIGYVDTIDKLEQDQFNELLMHLEDELNLSPAELRNYKKVLKKLYGFLYGDDVPPWVRKLKLGSIGTPIQPQDLPTKEEIDKMLAACLHPRDRALLAVLCDSGMRVGAVTSCRIKSVESTQYGSILYISPTSKSNKTTPAKGVPLTWSSGYLQQWVGVHPLREDPEAPLWVTLDKNTEALGYKTVRVIIRNIAKRAGIKRRIHPHLFRHKAITEWILEGQNEQIINHRAGWTKSSSQMYRVYGNFTDKEINDKVYDFYGLKTEDKKQVTLKKCPRCSNVLRPSDKFCSQCSLVLDRQAMDEIKKYEDKLPEILQMVMKSETAREMFGKVEKN